MKLIGLVVVSLLPGAAIAQSVILTSLAPGPLVATSGPTVQTAALPAGPMVPSSAVNAISPGSATTFAWTSYSNDVEAYFGLEQSCNVFAAGASASNGLIDIQVALFAPQVLPVRIDLARLIALPAGAPGPLLRVDVDNDGVFELTETWSAVSNSPSVSVNAQIGPTPLLIRVQMQMASSSLGVVENTLNAYVRPRTGITVNAAVVGCASNEWYWVRPTFTGNLNAYAQSGSNVPPLMVAVIGLGTAPFVLGGTLMPCLVIPSADLLVPIVPASLFGGPLPTPAAFTLQVPPGIGPLSLWTQAVVVEPTALTTTNAVRIDLP